MTNEITRIEIIGLHNMFDIDQSFQKGVNIIYAANGAGKTSLIHCLANILNGDYSRFLYVNFFRIRAWFSNDNFVTIHNENYQQNQDPEIRICINDDRRGKRITEGENGFNEFNKLDFENDQSNQENQQLSYKFDYTQMKVLLSTAYFPAFRTMIEAWQAVEDNMNIEQINSFARKIFGDFLPLIEYPTPKDIEKSLINQLKIINHKISKIDRQLMSEISVKYFDASLEKKLSSNINDYELKMKEITSIFEQIKTFPVTEESYISSKEIYINISEKISSNIINKQNSQEFVTFLTIYHNSLKKLLGEIQDKFYLFLKFLSSVNTFLKDKKIEIVNIETPENRQLVRIRFDNNSIIDGLSALSSGEYQIITIMYTATYMSDKKVILIDEPEISLHPDWQRKLIKTIYQQLSETQVIICTHSPMIAADYNPKELESKYTNRILWELYETEEEIFTNEDEEDYIEENNNNYDE
ncbi:AAA family ATPase [Anabaena sp. FACHB-1237]|uniref:AAA family ATPase n=1 Tax=Anabaena sp. FACHB-1237 TaxID=2692769 RepID=UPI001680353F|nr:AAA family ATPase [Anabaena sp. FACHB-1237]MBD2137691.1 AAA family ATPase [Anabaena sp. FACHB-1237]